MAGGKWNSEEGKEKITALNTRQEGASDRRSACMGGRVSGINDPITSRRGVP